MPNLHDIERRINSVTSTKQITRTMEMVAAAKIRRSSLRMERALPWANALSDMLVSTGKYAPTDKAKVYRAFAVKQLATLSSDEYFSKGDEIGHWLLKHGVGAKPYNGEIDTPLDYGDYYYLEALLRLRGAEK